jgi:hypothetical protein
LTTRFFFLDDTVFRLVRRLLLAIAFIFIPLSVLFCFVIRRCDSCNGTDGWPTLMALDAGGLLLLARALSSAPFIPVTSNSKSNTTLYLLPMV